MPFSNAPALVSVEWLRQHLDDPGVVILDCRWRLTDRGFGAEAYAAAHIPRARRVDMETDLSAPPGLYGGRHPLPSPQDFEQLMRRLGVRSDSYVVCYDDDAAGAARCWWCLSYFGHSRVSVLDGGMAAWVRAGCSLESGGQKPIAEPGNFAARPDPRMVVGYQTVKNAGAVVPVLDARAPERYRGTVEPLDRVGGHIPGAVNLPYGTLLGEDGLFRRPAELAQILAPWLGSEQDPILYCGSGVTACVLALGMRHAGAEPLVYPGSWSDWIQHQDAVIEKG